MDDRVLNCKLPLRPPKMSGARRVISSACPSAYVVPKDIVNRHNTHNNTAIAARWKYQNCRPQTTFIHC